MPGSHRADAAGGDPTLIAAFPLQDRLRRLAWNLCYILLYRTSPRPLHGWRSLLLRAFGAKMGAACHFYPKSKIWAPWNLVCEDRVTVADDAELYNPSLLHLDSHVIVSQGAYICGATHRYDEPSFRLVSFPMRLGAYSWICARAAVNPGVNVGNGAILALGSIATKDLEPFGIYAGAPAKKVKERSREAVPAPYNQNAYGQNAYAGRS
ncbi:putative colanic acid biosynthesis acetyltransferase [Silvibacterium dinghuense]|uniref:Putative colanic acid biosynthesis acetyltransferase n=1 Tax=Silvibacterium dinghuense TaxID=1560006 RepID=A0A4Q1SF23_9BACT|nr:putative colanic acid biosynthesis acetyltransferase [Silvibacterium dinghuense]